MRTIFHRLFQKDLNSAIRYYDAEGGRQLGDRFFAEVETVVCQIRSNPRHFHYVQGRLRRASLNRFPYHILFEESETGIMVLVLRHDKRHPAFGLGRRRPQF